MTKIVVAQSMNFLPEHQERLKSLGDVVFYEDKPQTPEEWLKRTKDFDIICSNIFGVRDKWDQLHDVFISVPFVGIGFLDPVVLRANNVLFARSPGCNSYAVSEWAIGMMITIARQLDKSLNVAELPAHQIPAPTLGLAQKRVTILGKGYIGSKIGKICEAMDMRVSYFRRGDSLTDAAKDADFVINALSANPSTKNILNKAFFDACKDGATFISVSGEFIIDLDAMFAALDSSKLAYVAHDAINIQPGETKDPLYQKLRTHSRGYATPHISFNTDVTQRIGNDMMIDNVEAFLNGKPINLVQGYNTQHVVTKSETRSR